MKTRLKTRNRKRSERTSEQNEKEQFPTRSFIQWSVSREANRAVDERETTRKPMKSKKRNGNGRESMARRMNPVEPMRIDSDRPLERDQLVDSLITKAVNQ